MTVQRQMANQVPALATTATEICSVVSVLKFCFSVEMDLFPQQSSTIYTNTCTRRLSFVAYSTGPVHVLDNSHPANLRLEAQRPAKVFMQTSSQSSKMLYQLSF